jgi:hypothetical protein
MKINLFFIKKFSELKETIKNVKLEKLKEDLEKREKKVLSS